MKILALIALTALAACGVNGAPALKDEGQPVPVWSQAAP